LHGELSMELNSMIAKLRSRREYPEDLLDFLNRWLIQHIANHDQLVAQHARNAVDRPVAESFYSEYLVPAPLTVAAPEMRR
jgi:hemerythrin